MREGTRPQNPTGQDLRAKDQDLRAKDQGKEAAVKDERHWVRLTRLCNQRCQFCLDSWNHNGTYVDTEELLDYIRKGREDGNTRLILSGGEPTIHPDFVKFVREGRRLGYGWVQTVTNGMMFAYPKFARAAVKAGLNEATFSIHGHNAKIQDALTGTPGAFDRAVEGIRNLQALGGVVINIDIVLNKRNYRFLPEILDHFMGMGIREFDLLYIIPFGRGFDDYRRSLFFDLDDDAYPYFQKAFEKSKLPGVYLWTNRLPVRYLENYEHLIQDPHKLRYEINGGRHNFEGLARWGIPPDCYGERCDHCFLAGICRDTLMPYQRWLKEGRFERIRLRVDQDPRRSERQWKQLLDQQAGAHWYTGPDTGSLAAGMKEWGRRKAPAEIRERVAELDDGGLPDPSTLFTLPFLVDRWVLRGLGPVVELLSGVGGTGPAIDGPLGDRVRDFEVIVDREVVDWLLGNPVRVGRHAGRLVFALRNHEYLSGSRDSDPNPEALRRLGAVARRFRNIPRCMTGSPPEGTDQRVLPDELVDAKGLLDLDAYVHHYVVEEYYTKSMRCDGCARSDGCAGLHINYVRNHGYRACQPLADAEEGGSL